MQIVEKNVPENKKSTGFFIHGKRRTNSIESHNPHSLRSGDNSTYASNFATLVFNESHYLPSAVTKGIIAIIRARFIATANSL
jgi:hypothetical protein